MGIIIRLLPVFIIIIVFIWFFLTMRSKWKAHKANRAGGECAGCSQSSRCPVVGDPSSKRCLRTQGNESVWTDVGRTAGRWANKAQKARSTSANRGDGMPPFGMGGFGMGGGLMGSLLQNMMGGQMGSGNQSSNAGTSNTSRSKADVIDIDPLRHTREGKDES